MQCQRLFGAIWILSRFSHITFFTPSFPAQSYFSAISAYQAFCSMYELICRATTKRVIILILLSSVYHLYLSSLFWIVPWPKQPFPQSITACRHKFHLGHPLSTWVWSHGQQQLWFYQQVTFSTSGCLFSSFQILS